MAFAGRSYFPHDWCEHRYCRKCCYRHAVRDCFSCFDVCLVHCLFAGRTAYSYLEPSCRLLIRFCFHRGWWSITLAPYSNLLSFAHAIKDDFIDQTLESVTQLRIERFGGALFLVFAVGIATPSPMRSPSEFLLRCSCTQIPAHLRRQNFSSHVKCAWSVT